MKLSPLRIQIMRADQKKKVITDNDNSRTLNDLKFESYEQLSICKRAMSYISRVYLINKKKELLPEPRMIFEKWFEEYSQDKAGEYISMESCIEFVKDTTGDPNV